MPSGWLTRSRGEMVATTRREAFVRLSGAQQLDHVLALLDETRAQQANQSGQQADNARYLGELNTVR